MEMIVVSKNELRDLVSQTIREALKNHVRPLPVPQKRNEGGIDFALEILSEKADLNSKKTVYKWTHEGRIPCEKRGKKLWFHRDQLEAWIEAGMPHNGLKQAANRLAKLNA